MHHKDINYQKVQNHKKKDKTKEYYNCINRAKIKAQENNTKWFRLTLKSKGVVRIFVNYKQKSLYTTKKESVYGCKKKSTDTYNNLGVL